MHAMLLTEPHILIQITLFKFGHRTASGAIEELQSCQDDDLESRVCTEWCNKLEPLSEHKPSVIE